jgi:hypothetical protein
MVFVAQSGERRFVEPKVVGSKPTIHPTYPCSSMEENLWLRTTRWEFESLRGYTTCPFRITEVQHSSKVSGRSSNL